MFGILLQNQLVNDHGYETRSTPKADHRYVSTYATQSGA